MNENFARTFNSHRVLLQPGLLWELFRRLRLSILIESYCNSQKLRSSLKMPQLSILIESYCNGASSNEIRIPKTPFNSHRVLLQHQNLVHVVGDAQVLSILIESYCNEHQISGRWYKVYTFNSHRVLLQLPSREDVAWVELPFNSHRVLLQRAGDIYSSKV